MYQTNLPTKDLPCMRCVTIWGLYKKMIIILSAYLTIPIEEQTYANVSKIPLFNAKYTTYLCT